MYLTPTSHITIGKATFTGVNEIVIKKSVVTGESTADITLPRNYIKKDNKSILDLLNKGDMVEIKLGYKELQTEFKGYVKSVSDATPIKIECEDEWYPFRREKVKPECYSDKDKCTVKDILSYAMPGFAIEAPDIDIPSGYQIDAMSKFAVIESLRISFGLCVFVDFATKKLTLEYAYNMKGFNTYTYVFGTRDTKALQSLAQDHLSCNVKKHSLTFEKNKRELRIIASSKLKTGPTLNVEVGSEDQDAIKIPIPFYNIDNRDELEKRAKEELDCREYSNYTGSITGFGTPRTQAGDSLKLIDPDNPEREGTYLIDKVTINYSVSENSKNRGFERINEISYKIQ
jgi:IS1 family transposase